MQKQETSELQWLAFRYVSGEMGDDEHDAFEARLTSDQDAREAVVSAVRLIETVIAAETSDKTVSQDILPPGAGRSSREEADRAKRSRWQPIAMAVLCGALLVGVWFGMQGRSHRGVVPVARSTTSWGSIEEQIDMLAFWSDWHALDDRETDISVGVTDDATFPDDMLGAGEAVDIDDNTESAYDSWNDEEFEVPGWMIAALSPESIPGADRSSEPPVEN